MRDKATQPATRSLTLRAIPDDAFLAIKLAVTEYNVTHPAHQIGQTDLVVLLIREWVARGGQLPKPDRWETPEKESP